MAKSEFLSTNSIFRICTRVIIPQGLNAYSPCAAAQFNTGSLVDSFAETSFASWIALLGLEASHVHLHTYTGACLINPLHILFIVAIILVSKCALKACLPGNSFSKLE